MVVPEKELLYESRGAGECPVCGEEDLAVVLLLALRVQEVIDPLV